MSWTSRQGGGSGLAKPGVAGHNTVRWRGAVVLEVELARVFCWDAAGTSGMLIVLLELSFHAVQLDKCTCEALGVKPNGARGEENIYIFIK